jgi:N-acetyl-gamma-glutamyl-phosphate reductase
MTMQNAVWSCVMLQVGIVGASGFTGAELLRLLSHHPEFEVVYATGDSQAGAAARELYPALAGAYPELVYERFDVARARALDAVFLGLPHEASLRLAPELVGHVACVLDLSAAYRLKDANHYPAYYGFEHDQPGLLADAVYGLPELHRSALKGAQLVATPGCYVTTATLALRPLVEAGLIETRPERGGGVIVDAASGVTGAGRQETYGYAFTTLDENFAAYGLLDHRHTPEMEQEIGTQVLFTPHLAPMNRGILATCYAKPAAGVSTSTEALLALLRERWAGEPFMVVTDGLPSTKATLGSNAVHVTARYDPRTNTVLAIAALDNLAKGASGGAIQAANVALGLDETLGLSKVGVAP